MNPEPGLALPAGTKGAGVLGEAVRAGRDAKVLLVEDEPVFRGALAGLLEDAGFDVTVACTGDEAVILLAEDDRFDVLMTDVTMPGQIGGVELAEHAREIHPGLPVVFVSGMPETEGSRKVGQPMAFFAKPCDVDSLLGTLGRLVDGAMPPG